jgi:hypothetical protein
MGVYLDIVMMRYFISHHQHKGMGIDEALKKEGWYFRRRRASVALFDHVINRLNPELGRGLVNKYYDEWATIITYPHGATGAWWNDSDYFPPNKKIFANLVIGEGHKHIEEIMRPYLQHYVIGWYFCPIMPFKKPPKVRNILFAPIHGSMHSNALPDVKKEENANVYKKLLDISDQYNIKARVLNPLENIGLWKDSRIKLIFGKPDGSYRDIDDADLVIAEGTFMYLSVARGKPTIGFGQHIPCSGSTIIENFSLKHWDQYKDYMAYPLNFGDDSLENLINRATNKEQTDWKNLFIGKEMDSKHLSDLLKDLRKQDISIRS